MADTTAHPHRGDQPVLVNCLGRLDPLETRFFVQSFVRFLNTETASATFAPDVVESLEVAIQCLETAYNLPVAVPFEGLLAADPRQHVELRAMFAEVCLGSPVRRNEAEQLKMEANRLMRAQQFGEALAKYDRAIYLDPANPTYYCNRAAIHTQLGNHQLVVDDCRTALRYDPRYAKAYGRLGIALARLGQLEEARGAYKSAQQFDPLNADYYNNALVVEMRLAEQQQQQQQLAADASSSAANAARAPPLSRTQQRPAAPPAANRRPAQPELAALPIIAQMLQSAGGGSQVERLQQQLAPLLRSVQRGAAPQSEAAASMPAAAGGGAEAIAGGAGASQLAVQMSQLINQLSEAVATDSAVDGGGLGGALGNAGIGGLLSGLLSGLDGSGAMGAAVAEAAAAVGAAGQQNQAPPRQN